MKHSFVAGKKRRRLKKAWRILAVKGGKKVQKKLGENRIENEAGGAEGREKSFNEPL